MVKCCICGKKAVVLDDDGLTPYCSSCWIEYCSHNTGSGKQWK